MKSKLTIAMSLLMTFISLLMAFVMYIYMKNEYLSEINSNRTLTVKTLATSSFEALLREDMGSIAYLGEQFSKQPDVLYVLVIDQGKKIVYDSRHKLEGQIFKDMPDKPFSRQFSLNGKRVFEVIVPFKIGETTMTAASVVYSMGFVDKNISIIFKTIFFFGLLGIVVGIVTSSFLAKWITLPLEKLTEGINAVEGGDLDYRIAIHSGDELERVGNEFNSMTKQLKEVRTKLMKRGKELESANLGLIDREKDLAYKNTKLEELNDKLQSLVTQLEESHKKLEETQAELMKKEKISAVLELAGAAAHEMNQPLTVIIGNIDLLLSQDKIDETRVRKTLEIINRASRELADIIKKMSRIRRYETDSYVGKVRILDLDRSSRE